MGKKGLETGCGGKSICEAERWRKRKPELSGRWGRANAARWVKKKVEALQTEGDVSPFGS